MEEREIRRLATALGIGKDEAQDLEGMIRAIHSQEGHLPCYSSPWSAPCRVENCPYAGECSSSSMFNEPVELHI